MIRARDPESARPLLFYATGFAEQCCLEKGSGVRIVRIVSSDSLESPGPDAVKGADRPMPTAPGQHSDVGRVRNGTSPKDVLLRQIRNIIKVARIPEIARCAHFRGGLDQLSIPKGESSVVL